MGPDPLNGREAFDALCAGMLYLTSG